MNCERFVQFKFKNRRNCDHKRTQAKSASAQDNTPTTEEPSQKCITFVVQLLWPHNSQKDGRSLVVHLVTVSASLQPTPSLPEGILPHCFHDPARHTSKSAWLWPLQARPDPENRFHHWRGLPLWRARWKFAWFFRCGTTVFLVPPRPCVRRRMSFATPSLLRHKSPRGSFDGHFSEGAT